MTRTQIYRDDSDPANRGFAYRHWDERGVETSGLIDDLEDLLDVLKLGGEVDGVDSLPSFGGEAPEDTYGVWSWDATRVLIGTCADDYEIVRRGN